MTSMVARNLAIFFLIFGPLKTHAALAPTKRVIGYSTINPRYVPLWVAREMGFFTKYRLETSLAFVRSTPILVAGLKSGQISFGFEEVGSTLSASVEKLRALVLEPLERLELHVASVDKKESCVTASSSPALVCSSDK